MLTHFFGFLDIEEAALVIDDEVRALVFISNCSAQLYLTHTTDRTRARALVHYSRALH